MSPLITGYIGIGILILAIFLRTPVAFAMMVIGFFGMLYLLPFEAALRFISLDILDTFSSYPLSAIPMFVLMGYYASAAGLTRRLYDVAYIWVGWLRGGLSMATVLACAAFAAVCGSSAATTASIGKIAYPEMKRYNYDDILATGCIAGGGVLGPLIPPSTGMIVYGLLTEQSIGKLLIAGIIPGLILTALFSLAVFIICRRNPDLGPPGPSTSWKMKWRSIPELTETFGLFLLVIGGLFAGWFTPTQAGSVGSAGALLIGLIRKNLSWRDVWSATKEALMISCMVLCLITGSIVFGHFLSLSTLPMTLYDWVKQLPVDRLVILVIVYLFYFIGGCFIDAMGLVVLSLPIVAPVIFGLGYDPIWFGVIIVVLAETGVLTPPVGVNVYVMKGIAPEVPLELIFKGIIPFLIAVCVLLVILTVFPSLATFLPSLMTP